MKIDLPSSPRSSLATAIRADSSRLIGLESDLATALSHSEELASVHGAPADWDSGCHHQWDQVEDILDIIHGLVCEMNAAILSNDKPGAQLACAAWTTIQEEENKLAAALSGVCAYSLELNEAARNEWQALVLTVESHRKVVRNAAVGFGARLETWKTEVPVAAETVGVLSPSLHVSEGMDTAAYARMYDQAAIEIEQEQHQVLELADSIKAMFMWVENPEERVRKNTPVNEQVA